MHEADIIARVRQFPHFHPEIVIGVGDDAAVLSPHKAQRWVWTTDLLIEDVHFRRHYFTPEQLAWKSLAVNLSDIAAMAGEPVAFTLSLGLPVDIPDQWVERFLAALETLSHSWQVELAGGDTVRSPHGLVIGIGILGKTDHPVLQQGASAGDILMVSGTFGGAAAGLYCLEQGLDSHHAFQQSLRQPIPRLREARQLAETCHGRLTLTDASDGLARALQLLCAGGVGCTVDLERIPLPTELATLARQAGIPLWDWVLQGGEDYELVAAIKPESQTQAEVSGWIAIGCISETPEICLLQAGQRFQVLSRPAGFQHFKRKI